MTLASSLSNLACIPSGPVAFFALRFPREIANSILFQYKWFLCSLNPVLIQGTKPCDTSSPLSCLPVLFGAEFLRTPPQIFVPYPANCQSLLVGVLWECTPPYQLNNCPCSKKCAKILSHLVLCYPCYFPGSCFDRSQRAKGTAGVPFISGDNLCWLIPFAWASKYREKELEKEMLAQDGEAQEGVWMNSACQWLHFFFMELDLHSWEINVWVKFSDIQWNVNSQGFG